MQQNVKTGLGIVLIVIIIITIFVFFLKSQTKQNNEPSTVRTNPVSQQSIEQLAPKNQKTLEAENYKIYKNDKYGFEFKYPDNYISKNLFEGVVILTSSDQDALPSMSVQKSQNTEMKNISIDQVIEKKIENKSVVSPKKTTFAGKPAYEGVDTVLVSSYAIYVKNNDDLFLLIFYTGNKDGLEANKAALDNNQKMMIESFKFNE